MANYTISSHVPLYNGANGFALLYNPVGSGVNLGVQAVTLAHFAQGVPGQGFDMRQYHYVSGGLLGTFLSKGKNKHLGQSTAQGELRWGNVLPHEFNAIFDFIVSENWIASVLNDRTYKFAGEFVVPPGYGLGVCAANCFDFTAWFEWREEAVS